MLFIVTELLMTLGFYLGWTGRGGVTLLGAALYLPDALPAPLIIGTHLS